MQMLVWKCSHCGNVITIERAATTSGHPSYLNEMGGPCPNSFDGKHSYRFDPVMTDKLPNRGFNM